MKASENPGVPKEPVTPVAGALMVAVASLFAVVPPTAPLATSSASVTTDNLKGNTRAEKKVNIDWVINDLFKYR